MMKTLSQTETSVLQGLLNWGEEIISRRAASMKPKHRASRIAARVAETGNPAGA
jgi:hypothetical protein